MIPKATSWKSFTDRSERELPMNVKSILIVPSNCRGCRSCQLACSFAHHGVFNPSKSAIVLDRDLETAHIAPAILPLKCDLCGGNAACVEACPYDAILGIEKQSDSKILVQA
jgi:ferredoxin